jgi:hypothetical protein
MKKLLLSALMMGVVSSMSFTSFVSDAAARDWYVSIKRGKGKKGSKEKPAKQLAFIAKKVKAGDVVHIAEGTYYGRGTGITVPAVSIIGGYSDDFSKRDPWGAHQTIISGKNKDYTVSIPRIKVDGKIKSPIVIEGLIFDLGEQNNYKTDKQLMISRKASNGKNPTPEKGALYLKVDGGDVTIRDNIIMNSAPTQGALAVFASKETNVTITNNLIINNTGVGIFAGTRWHGKDAKQAAKYNISNNSILFVWKYDAYVQGFSGQGIMGDASINLNASKNIFSFLDKEGVIVKGKFPVELKDNIFHQVLAGDYVELAGGGAMSADELEDAAEYLGENSEGNKRMSVKIPLSKDWLKVYASRVLIDRNKAESKVKAKNNDINAIRSMFGMNLQAEDLKIDSPVWLHRMKIEDALNVAKDYVVNGYGASKSLIK